MHAWLRSIRDRAERLGTDSTLEDIRLGISPRQSTLTLGFAEVQAAVGMLLQVDNMLAGLGAYAAGTRPDLELAFTTIGDELEAQLASLEQHVLDIEETSLELERENDHYRQEA